MTAGPAPAGPAGVAQPAFREIYEQYGAFIWRVVRRLGVRPADLEDVCQEVFVIVHRKLPGFAHRSSLRTWLYGIAVRCASDHRRRAHVRREVVAEAAAQPSLEAPQPAEIARSQARAALDAIVDALDDDKREVFVLIEIEQMSAPDVAGVIGIPVNTVYSRLRLARAELEQLLDEGAA